MGETLESWLRGQSLDAGTTGFRFEISICAYDELGVVLNISPINTNSNISKTIGLQGNDIIRFE